MPAGVDGSQGSPGSPGPLRAPPLPAQACTLARRARFRALLGDHGDGAGTNLLRKIQSKRNLPWRRRHAPSAAAGSPQPAERGGWGEERAGRFWFRFFVPAPLEATKKRAALPPDPAVCYLVACGWELGLKECCCQRLPRRPPYFCNFWKHPGERPRGFLDRKFGDSVGDASMIAILFLPVLLSSSSNSRVDLKKEKTQKGKTHRRWWPLPVLILGGYAFHKVNPPSCREP